jgi:hypothetical protein
MPRKRTPSPEQMQQDKQIVASFTHALDAISKRYGNERLAVAVELASAFAASPTPAPKPRTRKPKAVPVPSPEAYVTHGV